MASKIIGVKLEPITSSTYIRPMRFHFKQDGIDRVWDIIRVHDSVQVVLYHKDRRSLLFVKQFRPAVYLSHIPHDQNGGYSSVDWARYPSTLGYTLELCAGIVDKKKTLAEIVQDEIHEECGFDVPLSKIERVTSYRGGVGATGSSATMYYAEIDDSMKVSEGGGIEEERIQLEYIPVDDVKQRVLYDESILKPSSLLFGVMWFLDSKYPLLSK